MTCRNEGITRRLIEAEAWTEMLSRIGAKHARLAVCAGRTGGGASSVLAEIERERARIARELHAGAGQPLAGIAIGLDALEECLRRAAQRADAGAGENPARDRHEAIQRLRRLADAALGQVRAVSHRLHPPAWQQLSLTEAMRLMIEESGLSERCVVSAHLEPLAEEPSHAVKVALYRCAQECISNVLRHSGASHFRLSLTREGGALRMTVSDNGRGLPRDSLRKGGIGLAAIREHARSGNGDFRLSSGPGGTSLEIVLPLGAT